MVIAYINVKKLGGTSLSDEEVRELPNSILKAERILLQTLFFDLHTLHPYSHVVNKWKALFQKCVYLPEPTKEELQQLTLNFVNDHYRTDLCLQYRPDIIAHAAIFLATVHLDVKPEIKQTSRSNVQPSWIDLLETPADDNTVKDICMQLLNVLDMGSASRSDQQKAYKLTRERLEDPVTFARHHSSPNAVASGTPNAVSSGYQDDLKVTIPPPPPPNPPQQTINEEEPLSKRQKTTIDENAT